MIRENVNCFPNNIIDLLYVSLPMIDSDCTIVRRPMQLTDPDQTLAITAANWAPMRRSKEIAGRTPAVPVIQEYLVIIQGLIVDMDETAGLARHSVFAKLIRDMLYMNQPLRIALMDLEVKNNAGKVTEKLFSWDIDSQRFANNEFKGFRYLSTLELKFTTQVIV